MLRMCGLTKDCVAILIVFALALFWDVDCKTKEKKTSIINNKCYKSSRNVKGNSESQSEFLP